MLRSSELPISLAEQKTAKTQPVSKPQKISQREKISQSEPNSFAISATNPSWNSETTTEYFRFVRVWKTRKQNARLRISIDGGTL